jgi:DNA replication and repair protein RecF
VIRNIRLNNFRNYEQREFFFEDGITVIIGKNGRGKTNLLEALYFLLSGSSMRTADAKEMVRRGEENALVKGTIIQASAGDPVSIRVTRGISSHEGIKNREIKEYITAVSFQPDDIWMLKGGPEVRRRYLDEAVSCCKKGYRETLREYQRVLKQRNEALKEARKKGGYDGYVKSWDPLLLRAGMEIVRERVEYVHDMQAEMAEIGKRWGIGELGLRYYTTMGSLSLDEDALSARLERIREAEIRRGSTLIGPHRDEMVISLGGRSARRECSQGEQKLVAILWRLAQGRLITRKTGRRVLLLMDDCLSELDSVNRRKVVGEVAMWEQAVLTTTDGMEELEGLKTIFLE